MALSSSGGSWVPPKSIMTVPTIRPSRTATTASPSGMVAAMVSSDSSSAVGGGSTGRRAANAACTTATIPGASDGSARRSTSSRPSGSAVLASSDTARDGSGAVVASADVDNLLIISDRDPGALTGPDAAMPRTRVRGIAAGGCPRRQFA